MPDGGALVDTELIKTISSVLNAGAFGLVAWLFMHLFKNVLPKAAEREEKRQAEFVATIERLHQQCDEQLSHQRKNHEHAMQMARETHERQIKELSDVIATLSGNLETLADKIASIGRSRTRAEGTQS